MPPKILGASSGACRELGSPDKSVHGDSFKYKYRRLGTVERVSAIAASQVVTAIYAYLPFKSRIKPISLAVTSLTVLFDQAEHGWFAVAEGELTDSQVNDARYKIRKSKTKIMSDTVGVLIIPHDLDLMKKAEQEAMTYFTNYHPGQRDE
jgi:hypothetical protein